MAYPYICAACLTEEHDRCEGHKDIPPKDSGIIGGGVCVCQHQEDFGAFEKEVIRFQMRNVGEDE